MIALWGLTLAAVLRRSLPAILAGAAVELRQRRALIVRLHCDNQNNSPEVPVCASPVLLRCCRLLAMPKT